jgi:amidohydrolase
MPHSTGMETAFKATYKGKSEKPKIAFLAEYDALPEIGHGCGHNLIGTASIGAAIGLAKEMQKLPGTILVLGTPAEETYGAKVPMVKKGVFEGIDAAMMVHPSNLNAVEATSLAMDAIEFTFKGKAAHAAAAPHLGIDAVDAVTLMFAAVDALREHVREDARIHRIITEGGKTPNIIPEKAVARFYIRASTKEYLKELVKKVKNCARGAVLATGTKLTLRYYENSFENLVINSALAEVFKRNLLELGVREISWRVAMKGSTDMGLLSKVVPTIHPYLAIASENVALHSREFARAANSKKGHGAMILAAKAIAMTAIDLLYLPSILEDVKEEFESIKK